MKQYRSAKTLLLDNNDYVLVLRRSETHPRAALQLDLPGGMIEKDEDPLDGTVREIFEETKIKISSDQLSMIHEYTHTYENDGVTMERFLYAVRFSQDRPNVETSWEHEEHLWLPVSELTTLEHPVQHQVNEILKEGKLDSI
jgi:8-oxo-dGTP pyrophosphatase MutT (NUDIX family)